MRQKKITQGGGETGGQERESSDEQTLLSDVDELAGVHALDSDEGRGALLEAEGVAEDDLGKRSTTAGIVNDWINDEY
jgi:hypothetical protein